MFVIREGTHGVNHSPVIQQPEGGARSDSGGGCRGQPGPQDRSLVSSKQRNRETHSKPRVVPAMYREKEAKSHSFPIQVLQKHSLATFMGERKEIQLQVPPGCSPGSCASSPVLSGPTFSTATSANFRAGTRPEAGAADRGARPAPGSPPLPARPGGRNTPRGPGPPAALPAAWTRPQLAAPAAPGDGGRRAAAGVPGLRAGASGGPGRAPHLGRGSHLCAVGCGGLRATPGIGADSAA